MDSRSDLYARTASVDVSGGIRFGCCQRCPESLPFNESA
jgi:hypothetical protein